MTPRLIRTAATAVIAAIVLALAPSAFAASEQGDAGDLRATAQDLGSAAVPSIMGSFTSGADVDVYRLCLSDGRSFSASTVGATTLDTQLFLFDSGGFGVYSNDDAGIGQRGSRLPAQHRFSPSGPGEYFLAISSFNRDPQSPQGEIFPDVFSQGFYPDGVVDAAGVGAAEPLTGWAGLARGSPGLYRIILTGTQACPPPDSTAPTVSLRSPADGARVRQDAEVVVDFSCADEGGSGLASCVGTLADGALLDTSRLGDVSVTVTARDHAGNQTVVKHTVTVVDETAPSIAVTTPAPDAVYALGEQVVADYACADEPNGSGLASCGGPVADGAAVDTATLGVKTFIVNASDNAGNSASKSVNYTVVDNTAPSIAVTTPAPGAVYGLGEPVVADYACADEPGGTGVATCAGSVADGALVDTATVGEKTFTVEASDNAGNSASESVSYTVVDSTAPAIVVTSPAEGAFYVLGQSVLADYSCQDEAGGSGVASCIGSVAQGQPLDTSSVGPKSFTVQASDTAGNAVTDTVAYSVIYDFDGFLGPLENFPSVNRWKAGRAVPVRFSLGSYRGATPVAAGYPKIAAVACGTGAQPAGTDKARGSWKRSSVRQSRRGRWTYMFLWKTDKKWSGSCRQLVLKLDDDTLHRVEVQFVRRGHHRDWERDWDDG